MMRADYPYTYRWLAHIDDMSGIEGEWAPGFAPVVHELVRIAGEVYAPFLLANAAAADDGANTFTMTAMGMAYSQGTFKYQVKCLRELRRRYAALAPDARAACDAVLTAPWRALLTPESPAL
jgi:hypothetical protein